MLKLSKLSDYATMLATAMASDPDRIFAAQELAARAHVSAPTTAKLLKLMAKSDLVESVRGARGGYRLRRSPEKITVADVISAVEGPIALTQCSDHRGACSIESSCATRTNWRLINRAIRQALEAVTLAQMAAPLKRTQEVPVKFMAAAVGSLT